MVDILSTAIAIGSVLFGGSGSVVLDDVVLAGFEVPEEIPFGTDQDMVIHKFPGGERFIQVMGPSPKPIAWTGIMLGANAAERAKQFDQMAQDGDTILLTWGTFAYLVIIKSFSANYKRENWIGQYSITCEVANNLTTAAPPSLLASITNDLSDALGVDIAGTLAEADAAVTTASAVIAPMVALIPGTANASLALGALASAQGTLSGLSQAAAGNGAGLIVAAASIGLVSQFPAALSIGEQTAKLPAMSAYVGRATTNMAAAS